MDHSTDNIGYTQLQHLVFPKGKEFIEHHLFHCTYLSWISNLAVGIPRERGGRGEQDRGEGEQERWEGSRRGERGSRIG